MILMPDVLIIHKMANDDKDLPLMANTGDILVDHYVLQLDADFTKKCFHGRVFLFLSPPDHKNVVMSTVDVIGSSNQDHDEGVDINSIRPDGTWRRRRRRPEAAKEIEIILDCKDLEVISVEEVKLQTFHASSKPIISTSNYEIQVQQLVTPAENRRTDRSLQTNCGPLICCDGHQFTLAQLESVSRTRLKFLVEKWCLRIWKGQSSSSASDAGDDVTITLPAGDDSTSSRPQDDLVAFPKALYVEYRTCSRGSSVIWRQDQNGRECCFTPGSWINNRSLFPCQEPPIATATWQAFVTIPAGSATVVMTSDLEPTEIERNGNHATYYCSSTRFKLPMSTLALAIGHWASVEVKPDIVDHDSVASVQSRILAPAPALLERATQELSPYVHRCLDAVIELLGPHPFPRLDFLFMPRCFDSLGLASPNTIFVSQSLLTGDGSMLAYVAHEVTHSWFGLAIGASDWSEEWLSEGFATYMGDVVHAHAMKWSEEVTKQWTELRAFIHYRTLVAELRNTQSDLQTLRPTKVENKNKPTDPDPTNDGSVISASVKNGMNPDKCFTQVHYLKGFFLLRYLSKLVGHQQFNEFLREYVRTYHGQLVNSQDVFTFFFKHFPEVSGFTGITLTSLYDQWLDPPGLPTVLDNCEPSTNNKLFAEILTHVHWWKRHNESHLRARSRLARKKRKWDYGQLKPFFVADQLVTLLELLIDVPRISRPTLRSLNEHYLLSTQNANVRHRWCELIVKHKYEPLLEEIERFLLQDQAMGVYLYGELLLSSKKTFRDLALKCWTNVQNEIGHSARQVLNEMFDSGLIL